MSCRRGGGGGPDRKYKKKFDLIKKYNLNNFFNYVSIFDFTVNFGDTKVFSYFTTKNLYLKENLDICKFIRYILLIYIYYEKK